MEFARSTLVQAKNDIVECAFDNHPEQVFAKEGDLLIVRRHRPGTSRYDVCKFDLPQRTFCVSEKEIQLPIRS